MSGFKEIKLSEIPFTPFDIKNKEWMLITAAKADGTVNTMTASWGGFGVMWNKEIVWVVIRPQRYTKEFVDNSESFSLSFLGEGSKKILSYLGKASGRDEDKIRKSELTVVNDNGIPYFEEAHTVIFAKKLYSQPLTEDSFIDKSIIPQWYENDFHILYMAEITKIVSK